MSRKKPMRFTARSWLGVAVIAAHNLEEALTAPGWLQPRLPQLRERFGVAPLAAEPERFYTGLILVVVVAAGWVAMASRAAPRTLAVHSLIVLYGMFLVNAFVPHLTASFILREYTPGVLTAALLVIPYCVWYFTRALVEGLVGRAGFVAAASAAIVLYVPLLLTLMGLVNR